MALSGGLFLRLEAYWEYFWGLGSPAPVWFSRQAVLDSQQEVVSSPLLTATAWRTTLQQRRAQVPSTQAWGAQTSAWAHQVNLFINAYFFECAISQFPVYEIKNSKWCIHPGFTISKPKTLMQSTLKIHLKKTTKQNELCVILYLFGSNSSTTFSLCTDQQDSWRLAHRHFLAENPFSSNIKKKPQTKNPQNPQIFQGTHQISFNWAYVAIILIAASSI